MNNIDKEARKLYLEVLKEYKNNPNLGMSEILDNYLAKYNDAIADELLTIIFGMMAAKLGGATMAAIPLTPPKLSSALYNNAKNTAKAAMDVINDHIANKGTINDLREKLYDGYGYDELLDIKKKLPKYLSKPFAKEKVDALRTKPLKNAYMAILDAKNDRELQKALKNALYEKARYYGHRIADTEEHRAFTLANADRQIKEGIKYVKWYMSSRHSVPCICEVYAYQDIGYGKGIYPLLEAPAPIYSTHPHCRCQLRDYYRTTTKGKPKPLSDPLEKIRKKHKPPVTIDDLFRAPEIDFGDVWDFLNSNASDEAKKAMEAIGDPYNIVEGDFSHYDPNTDTITSDTTYSDFMHEFGHHIDEILETISDKLKELLEKDALNIKQKTKNAVDAFFKYAADENGIQSQPIIDMLDSIFDGELRDKLGLAGHGADYWKIAGNKEAEAFANMFELWSNLDKYEWNRYKDTFPHITEVFEELMEKLIKESKKIKRGTISG